MLTVAKASGGKEAYYSSLGQSSEDYYVGSKTQPAGVWVGEGAERLKLEGKAVEPEVFRNLFRGYAPDGAEKWVQNAGRMGDGKRDRMPGYDFTFSAPKSVSIVRAIGSDELQRAIERVHFEAVTKALESAERQAIVRSGKGGSVKEEAGLIVGVFQHMTARQINEETLPDMLLHSHAVIINTGVTERGRAGALSGGELFFQLIFKDMDAAYKTELAKGLIKLGFQLELTKDGFEIKGIKTEAIEYFSKRTRQIDELVDRENSTKGERQKVAIETRVSKREINSSELERHWMKECEKFGLTARAIDSLRGPDKAQENLGALVVSEAAKGLAAKQTLYSIRELEERTFAVGAHLGISEKEAKKAALDYIKSKESMKVAVESETGTRLYTTREDPNSARVVKALEEKKERAGGANLQAVTEAAKEQGYRVLVCSVKRLKVESLKEEGIQAYTMAKILSDLEQGSMGNRKGGDASLLSRQQAEWLYSTWQISAKDRAQLIQAAERAERKIDEKTVVILNEPDGIKQNEAFRRFLHLVKQNGGEVVHVDAAKTPAQEIKRRVEATSGITFERKEEKPVELRETRSLQVAEEQQRQRARSR